jgi:hypothetical protein
MRGDAKTTQEGDEQNTRPDPASVLFTCGTGTGLLCAGPILLPEAAPRRYAICRSSVAVPLLLSRLATQRHTRLSRSRSRCQLSTAAPIAAIRAVMVSERSIMPLPRIHSSGACPRRPHAADGLMQPLDPAHGARASTSSLLLLHAPRIYGSGVHDRRRRSSGRRASHHVSSRGSSRVGASLCRQRGYRALARAPTRTPVRQTRRFCFRFVRARPCSLQASKPPSLAVDALPVFLPVIPRSDIQIPRYPDTQPPRHPPTHPHTNGRYWLSRPRLALALILIRPAHGSRQLQHGRRRSLRRLGACHPPDDLRRCAPQGPRPPCRRTRRIGLLPVSLLLLCLPKPAHHQ